MILNLIGYRCPDTLMMIRNRIRKIVNGESILIITDDTTINNDLKKFCYFMNYKILYTKKKNNLFNYLIKK